MVAYKIKAIWRIIRCEAFNLYTRKGDEVTPIAAGVGDIADIVQVAVVLKRDAKLMSDVAEQIATEQGELHTLTQLREAVERLENAGD